MAEIREDSRSTADLGHILFPVFEDTLTFALGHHDGIQRDKLLRRPELIVPWYQENWIAADAKAFSRISNKEQKLILNAQTAIRQKPRTFVDDIGLLGKEWGFDISNVTGVSVSIWSGDSDIVVPPEMAELLHRQISGSSFVIGPGEGHASMLKNHAPSILSKF